MANKFKITVDEQCEIRKRARNELTRLHMISTDLEVKRLIDDIKEKNSI